MHEIFQYWIKNQSEKMRSQLMTGHKVSWGISSQTWIKTSVSSCTVCVGTWWSWMQRYTMSQRCWIGIRPGEGAGQSISQSSSSRSADTLQPHITHTAMHQRELIWSHPDTSQGNSFFLLLAHGGVWGPPRTASPDHHSPTNKLVMLEDVSGNTCVNLP